MSNKDVDDLTLQLPKAHVHGDVASMTRVLTLSAATVADVFRFIRLPANSQLLDAVMKVTDAADASTTLTLGYQHVGGESGDDTSHFLGATAISATGVSRADQANAAPTLSYNADIVGVLAGANVTEQTIIEVTVLYKYLGSL